MGLFGFGKKKAAKPMAPVKKPRLSRDEQRERAKQKLANLKLEGEARALREEQRYMAEMKRRDPARWRKIVEQRLGIIPDTTEDEPRDGDALDLATDQLRRLRRFEVVVGKHVPGEGPSRFEAFCNSTLATAIAQALGPDLLRAFAAAVTGQKLPSVEPATITITSPTAPQVVNAAVPSAATVADAQGAEVVPDEPPSAPLLVQWAISQLEHKEPHEAAAWLVSLSQKRDDARQLVQLICRIQDEQIPTALAETEQRYPNLAPLVAWLRARPEWLLATVQEVRQTTQPAMVGSIVGGIMDF